MTVTCALEMAPSADAGTPSSAPNGSIIPTSRPRKSLRIATSSVTEDTGTRLPDPFFALSSVGLRGRSGLESMVDLTRQIFRGDFRMARLLNLKISLFTAVFAVVALGLALVLFTDGAQTAPARPRWRP